MLTMARIVRRLGLGGGGDVARASDWKATWLGLGGCDCGRRGGGGCGRRRGRFGVMTMVVMVVVMVAMMTSVARCKLSFLGFHDRALEQRTARGTRVPRPYVLVTAHTITALVITALVITALVCNVVGRRFDFQPPAVRTSGGRHRRKGARKPRIQPRLGGRGPLGWLTCRCDARYDAIDGARGKLQAHPARIDLPLRRPCRGLRRRFRSRWRKGRGRGGGRALC